jgi:hypothetical protein
MLTRLFSAGSPPFYKKDYGYAKINVSEILQLAGIVKFFTAIELHEPHATME